MPPGLRISPRRLASPGRALDGRMAVVLGLSAGAILFALLLVGQPLLRSFLERPLPSGSPSERPPEVDLWVGDLGPGVKGILSGVYDDPSADARNDRSWNDGLGLPGPDGLAYYQLHVFNTSPGAVRVALQDGLLTITPAGGDPLPMRSLAALLASAGKASAGKASPALVASLTALGSAREAIDVPAGTLASPFVAFPRRVGLGDASAVARVDGLSFHRRRIPRDRWEDLRASPSARRVEDL